MVIHDGCCCCARTQRFVFHGSSLQKFGFREGVVEGAIARYAFDVIKMVMDAALIRRGGSL